MEKALTVRGRLTRERILDAAAKLVYDKGVEGTSLDDVRNAVGVSKSQLYHYFSDKDALVREIIVEQTERVLAAQEPALSRMNSLPGLRRWRDTILALYRSTGGTGSCPLGTLANELANYSESARILLVAGFESWVDRLSAGFIRMQANGTLVASANPRDLAVSVLTATQGGLLLAKTSRSSRPLELALEMALKHVGSYGRRRSK